MKDIVFTKEDLAELSIENRLYLFLLKWDKRKSYYFNMSMNDIKWRERGWAISKEEFVELIKNKKVILNERSPRTVILSDMEDFLMFHGF